MYVSKILVKTAEVFILKKEDCKRFMKYIDILGEKRRERCAACYVSHVYQLTRPRKRGSDQHS